MKGLETARQLAAQVRPTQTTAAPSRASRLTIEKMRRALPEFQDTSDRDLVELWSQANGRDFGELADEVGLATSSTLGEMAGQFGQGLRVDTPRMVGQALQYFSGGDNQFAQRMIEGAERRGLTALPDPRGRGAIANDALIAGARGLGPVAATLATSVLPGGQVIAPALAAATFGGSGAYETYQRVFEETGDAEAASAAARRVGVLQGGGEAIATMAGGALIRPAVAAVRGAPTTARVVDAMTDTRVLRPAAAGIAKNTAVQVGTEIGQDVGTSMIEQSYGAAPEDLGDIAYQSGMAAAGMSLLLGGFGIGGYRARARQADRIQKALDGDPSVAPEDRARILGVVNQEAERRGVSMTDRETWVREQLLPAEQRKNETLDRMEQIRAEIALTDRDNTQGREALVAEFRKLYDAPSGERAPTEDGTEVELTNGQLMAREITAMRERQRTEQKDPDAEIDITQTPAVDDRTATAQLENDIFDFVTGTNNIGGGTLTLEQLQNTDATTLPADLQRPFQIAVQMAGRKKMSSTRRAQYYRDAIDILETASPADANAMGMGWVIPREGVSTTAAPTEQEQAATQMGRQQQALESLDLLETDIEAQETPPFVTRGQEQAFDQVQQQQPVEDETLTGAPRITAMTPEAETQMDRQRAALQDIEQTQPTRTPTIPQMEQREQGRLRGAFDQVMQRSQDLDTQEVVQAQRRFPVPAGEVETGTPTPPAQRIAPAQDRMFSRATDAELERVIAAEDTVPYRRRMARAELERRQAPAALPPVTQTQRTPEAEQQVQAEAVDDADIEVDTKEDLERIDTLFKDLDAEVEGTKAPKSAGKVSLPQKVLIAIRNAVLNPGKRGQTVVRVPGTTAIDQAATAEYGERIRKISAAATRFANSYDALLTKAGNLTSREDQEFSGREQLMSEANALLRVGAPPEIMFALNEEIRNSGASNVKSWWGPRNAPSRVGTPLRDLLVAHEQAWLDLVNASGNDKNVDAIVRLVKDRAQKKLASTVGTDVSKRLKAIDTTLSRAWNAARRGVRGVEQAFDVRPGETRTAKEAASFERTQIQYALEGENKYGSEAGPGGIVGVMDYYVENGTIYEKTLARAIRAVVVNMGDNAPTMKLKAGDKPRYNPATNTIHIGTDASASVILHESLHGALQWYVYNNQNSPQVNQLIKAVEQVVAYNGNLGAKAQEVQNILKKLVKGDRMIDAVLELVSYGNTLNEFRTALDQMGTIGTPLTFRENVEKVWRSILNVVNTMLGLKPNATLANDVIKNTFMLLEGAANPESIRGLNNVMAAGQKDGKTLYATVTGTDMPSRDADASTGQYQRAMPQKNLEKFNKKILPEWMSSKFVFDAYGGWWGNSMAAIDKNVLAGASAYIQKNSPKLTTVIKWVNNNYGLQGAVADLMLRAKDDRRGGSIQVEVLADHLASLPTEMTRKVLASLDARLEALRKGEVMPPVEGIDRKSGIDLLAADMLDRWWEYARTTRDERLRARMAGVYNPKTKQWEGGVKFSQGLIIPDNLKNIVSPTFGEQALTKFTKLRTKFETNEDAIHMRADSNGDPVLTDKFIGLYRLDAGYQQARRDGVSMADIQPHEFISVERFMNGERPTWGQPPMPMDFDNAYLWTLERKGDKGYKMTAQLDLSSAAAAKSSQQIAGALKNTMAIMANSYSATRLTDSLYAHGRGTPNAVAYDNLDELNSVLQGKYVNGKFEPQLDREMWKNQIRGNNVLEGRERGADAVRDGFNTSSSWIRVPAKATYGALAGKIVQGSVWNTLQDTYDTRPVIALRQANTIMRWFKKAKTQYNPATWGTNVATNFTMAMMDDIPMQTIATASRLYFGYMLPDNIKKTLRVNINLTREEQELMAGILGTNAMIGTVSTAELRQDVFEAMRDSFGGPEMSLPSRIMQFMKMEKNKLEAFEKRYGEGKTYAGDRAEAFDKFMSDWYAAQDNVFRVASMLNKLGQMKSEGRVIDAEAYRVAGDHARFAFLDYDIDSKAVKLMRQTAFPFISWPYAAAKLIGHVAVHKPWKLVNLYAGYWMLDALLQTITGDDEDELRKAGPEWARDRMFFGMGPHTHLRVPFLGDDENPVYYNLGKYIAPSSFGETVPNPFMGADWWPSFVTPGGPFISGALIITAGIDPFTGDKISPPTASTWENVANRARMVQGMFTPNLPFVNITETTKFFEAMTARVDRSENYDDLYLARLAGLRFYDFNVDGARQAQSRAAQAIRRDFDIQISRLRRSMLRHETPDYDKFIREREKLRARLDERLAELTGDDNNF